MSELERRFLENAALQANIEYARAHPEQRVVRRPRPWRLSSTRPQQRNWTSCTTATREPLPVLASALDPAERPRACRRPGHGPGSEGVHSRGGQPVQVGIRSRM